MKEKNLIISGIIIFLIIVASPFVMGTIGKTAAPKLDLTKAKEKGPCVYSAEKMRTEHMQVLDTWRNTVVRDGMRKFVVDGKEFDMSLSTGDTSCLGCHGDKKEFCDKCHTYASVAPYCWDCHTEPKNTSVGEDAEEANHE